MTYDDCVEREIKKFYDNFLIGTVLVKDYFELGLNPDPEMSSVLDLPIFQMLLDVKLSEHKNEWKKKLVEIIEPGVQTKLAKYSFNQMYDYIDKNQFDIIMSFDKYIKHKSPELEQKLREFSYNLRMLNCVYYATQR